jgi:membrane protease YdiL (CAAX protease family)
MKPLFIFFVLAYLISWIIWLPLYDQAIGIADIPALPYNHGLGGLGPLLASFLTILIYNKKDGIKRIVKQVLQIRPIFYLVIAVFSPFLLAFITMLYGYFVDNSSLKLSTLLTSTEFPEFNFFTIIIYNLVFFGFGEEVGWRGFALPRLQENFNALSSSFILTAFWAIWHLPLFLYRPGYMSMELAGTFGWVFSLLTGSILLTWLFNETKGSVLICAVYHSTIDIAFTADYADVNTANYLGLLITVWGLATVIIFKAKNLSNKERIKYTDS